MVAVTDYAVEIVAIDAIKPSPENDEIYGEVRDDEQMDSLTESILNRGLEEPIIVSNDGFIISGHRRYHACCSLNMKTVPIRRKSISRKSHRQQWHKILAEYNPQRIKTAGALLREALLRHADSDPAALLEDYRQSCIRVDAEFTEVDGFKFVRDISAKKSEFLEAAKFVINVTLSSFWPVTVRQVHYQLLNDPPLISKPQRSKFDVEHYRYKNDARSYEALIELLKQARYAGEIPMHCIDDPTRPKFEHTGYRSLSQFLSQEMNSFLCGYHRNRQLEQPRHIEVLGEKNTLLNIVRPVCREYYVPLTLARGYASTPVWREMASRFKRSGKYAFTLIIASDFDPEGLDLAKDAIRTLRDLWDIPVDYHRVSVTREQIEELNLTSDFNPAKAQSSRFKQFVEETGGEKTWELESLPPAYLQQQVRSAIESNMDMTLYEQCVSAEREDARDLVRIRSEIVRDLNF